MERLGDIISHILSRYGKRLKREMLKIKWEEIVGMDLAARTIPMDLEGDILYVAVPDGIWANEYRLREEVFLERLKDYEVERVRFFPKPHLFLRRRG